MKLKVWRHLKLSNPAIANGGDRLQHTRRRTVARETRNSPSVCVHILIAHVIGVAIDMLAAIEFHDQPAIQTDKVCDIPADRKLPAKLAAIELPIAQSQPKFGLSDILGRAQGPS